MQNTEHDPLNLHEQEEAAEDRKIKRRLEAETEEADLRWLLSSRRGRRIVWRQLEAAGVHRSVFNTNALQMAFTEGWRNSGNRLLALVLDVAPETYPVMLKENAHERDRNADAGKRK